METQLIDEVSNKMISQLRRQLNNSISDTLKYNYLEELIWAIESQYPNLQRAEVWKNNTPSQEHSDTAYAA